MDVLLSFAAMWGMPLLFVVSGMGIWYSLRSRTIGAFAGERVRRLLVPLVFGLLVIVPPQVWTWLRGDPEYDESYWEFLPRFFDIKLTLGSFPFVIGDDPATGLFEPGHLWFLVVLLAFSLLFLPIFWYLRQPAGGALVKRLAQRADHLWVIAAAGLPFGVLDAAFVEHGQEDVEHFGVCLLDFVEQQHRERRRAHRRRQPALLFVTHVAGG